MIDEYKPSTSKKKESPWLMRINWQATVVYCDRYAVSDRAAGGIASSVLKDVGLITETDVSKVIDRIPYLQKRLNLNSFIE